MDDAQTQGEEGPLSSRHYLDMIEEAEKAFSTYQDKCNNIDKLYASLQTMADTVGDREFQIFWANIEVLKEIIYTRPPQPVVQPRHSQGPRREIARKASELLERALEMDVEADDLHDTLLEVRDDLTLSARGVPWVLDNGQCIHVDREDFVHEPARKWSEVGWVARRAYLTRDAVKERFPEADTSRMKFEEWKSDADGKGNDYRSSKKKAQVWEVWHRGDNQVIWVSPGHPDALDAQDPLVEVKGFFPCPKPAYATCERRTLKPVPDFIYYRDQVDEINELTARISSLSESLRLKGFYAAGEKEVGEAVEAAMKQTDNKALLVPVSSLAALGGGGIKDAILWLPIKEVAETIVACVELRKQLIEDVYQITGLSDIMRGETEASETATAQNIKAQYGAVRVRGRQGAMIRVARDVFRLKAEIMAENVPAQEIALMADMEIPTMAQAQQMAMQAQQNGEEFDVEKVVTIEQIDALLKNQRLRPFVLDVESDSTIAPNEEAEKASRIEFIAAVGGFIQQAGGMVAAQPETAPFAAKMLKFTANSFRGGRELQGAIDEFAESIEKMASQPKGPSPEQMKAQADQQKMQMDLQMAQQKAQADLEATQVKAQMDGQKLQAEIEKMRLDAEMSRDQSQADLEKTGAEIQKIMAEIERIKAQPREQNAA